MPSSNNGRPGDQSENSTLYSPQSHKPSPDKMTWMVRPDNAGNLGSGNATTYSFTDVHASIILPFNTQVSPKCDLPGLTLVSLSEHRDVYPVVGLGGKGIKGYSTGHRTTAGTLGFVLFGQNPFAEAIQKYVEWKGVNGIARFTSPDELPPVDLVLVFANEKKESTTLLIRAVKILDRSQNISVRDIQLTEVYSFMAANCSYFIEDLVSNKPDTIVGKRLNAPNQFLGTKTLTSPTTSTTSTTTSTTTTSTTTTSTTSTTTTPTTTSTTTSTTITTSPTSVPPTFPNTGAPGA